MALIAVPFHFTASELANIINANINELDMSKASVTDLGLYLPYTLKGAANGLATLDQLGHLNEIAKTAIISNDYNTSEGSIATKFGEVDTEISNIKNGNTTVGKAIDLNPTSAPGNSMYYGTSGAGTVGWHPVPVPADGAAPPSPENFTNTDIRWGALVGGVYTLTIPHGNRYPLTVFKQDGAVFSMVFVDVQRDNTNVLIRTNEKFTGYVVLG